MKITTKPFESKYREGVVDVLQHLWHEGRDERFAHFDWLYFGNPSHPEPLAVVAVNENDEVMGFRGWVPGIVKINGNEYLVARAADVVVSPKARRQGVFSKMTVYSLSYLKENSVHAILNLSSNSQSNPGYRKLGWIAITQLNIWYRILMPSLLHSKQKILNDKIQLIFGKHSVSLYPYIPKGLIAAESEGLAFSMEDGQLDWYANRPYKKYITLTANNAEGKLDALYIVEIEEKMARLLYFYCKDPSHTRFFKILQPYIGRYIISAWGWALSERNKSLLKKMGFVRIPFYERIKKKPPILVRSIGDPEDDNNWKIEGKDIRDINCWNIHQIDDF